MPYITNEDRDYLDDRIHKLIFEMKETAHSDFVVPAGIVNYVITRIVTNTMKPVNGWTYGSLSKALAVFRDAEAEMRRRLLDSYEDKAIAKNGDIPEYESPS